MLYCPLKCLQHKCSKGALSLHNNRRLVKSQSSAQGGRHACGGGVAELWQPLVSRTNFYTCPNLLRRDLCCEYTVCRCCIYILMNEYAYPRKVLSQVVVPSDIRNLTGPDGQNQSGQEQYTANESSFQMGTEGSEVQPITCPNCLTI